MSPARSARGSGGLGEAVVAPPGRANRIRQLAQSSVRVTTGPVNSCHTPYAPNRQGLLSQITQPWIARPAWQRSFTAVPTRSSQGTADSMSWYCWSTQRAAEARHSRTAALPQILPRLGGRRGRLASQSNILPGSDDPTAATGQPAADSSAGTRQRQRKPAPGTQLTGTQLTGTVRCASLLSVSAKARQNRRTHVRHTCYWAVRRGSCRDIGGPPSW